MTQTVIIVGASSGIGEALARQYAACGYNIGLSARRTDKLAALAAQLTQQYSVKVVSVPMDMQDEASIAPALHSFQQVFGEIDLLIANAGITGVRRTGRQDIAVDKNVLQTNLLGQITLTDETVKIMLQQTHGHIVGISSFSAFSPIPGSAAYSASKAALSNYLNAVRLELLSKNIDVTVIHPGFIRTDLAANMDKYPFSISADVAAQKMVKVIKAKKANAIVPAFPWKIIKLALQITPDALLTFFTKQFFKK